VANDYADFELLLLEGGSRDDTVAVLEGLAARDPRIRVVAGLPSDLCSKRNAGMNEARGSLLVYCDDDTVPSQGWIGAYVRAAESWDSLMVGATFPRGDGPAVAIRPWTTSRVWKPTFWNKVVYWPIGVGANFACSQNIAREVGGWDSRFPIGEDSDFFLRVLRSGRAIRTVPEAVVEHDTLSDWHTLVRKRHGYARGATYLLRRKYARTLHGWCSIAVFLGTWSVVLAADLLTLRRRRIRLSWHRLCGGLAGLFGSSDWAEHEAAMAARFAAAAPAGPGRQDPTL